ELHRRLEPVQVRSVELANLDQAHGPARIPTGWRGASRETNPRLRAVSTIVAPGSLVADAELDAIRGIAEAGLPAFLADLERLVNVDCGSYTPVGGHPIAPSGPAEIAPH